MNKNLYNILYAISYAALIFTVTYVVFGVFEGLRQGSLQYICSGTEFSRVNESDFNKVLEVLAAGIATPIFGLLYTLKYVALFTLIIPICHIIEIIIDKIGINKNLQFKSHLDYYLSILPYILIGLGTMYYLSNMYYVYSVEYTRAFDGFTISHVLKYAVYGITLIAIVVVSYYAFNEVWSTKMMNVSTAASKWIDILPLGLCVLSIIAMAAFILSFCSSDEHHYYYHYY